MCATETAASLLIKGGISPSSWEGEKWETTPLGRPPLAATVPPNSQEPSQSLCVWGSGRAVWG